MHHPALSSCIGLGDFTLRTYDPSSFAQQAVTFLCLDFNGVSTRHNGLPQTPCPSGIRAQIVSYHALLILADLTPVIDRISLAAGMARYCPLTCIERPLLNLCQNVDSPDHKSHVSFLSTGPDSGTCNDPKFPVTLPRIFMEVNICASFALYVTIDVT